jgi:hypothetical protein
VGKDGPLRSATLLLHPRHAGRGDLAVQVASGARWRHGRLAAAGARRAVRSATRSTGGTIAIDVTRAVRGDGDVTLVVSEKVRGSRPRLVLRTNDAPPPKAGAPPAPAPASAAPAQVAAPAPAPTLARPTGMWVSAAELASKPTSGPAWNAVKAAADASASPNIADQDSLHDVDTLAAGLVYSRTGAAPYRSKAAAAIAAAMGTERGGRTLALGRNLASYVVAADLIGLGALDPALDARFRAWLSAVRTEPLDGRTLISTNEERPNNWGTMAGASRIAADIYLGDTADLNRAATVFRGWLGERGAWSGFKFGDLSWQADPANPVGINAPGTTRDSQPLDGAQPEEMRRGGTFATPPAHTNYPWEALQGAVVQAQLLSRQGFDAWNWGSKALLRASNYLADLDARYGGWWAQGDDSWQPWLLNRAYGTTRPAPTPTRPGKIMGFTDWTLGG